MSGLTEAGLEIETFETLVAGVKAEIRQELGASLDLGDTTPDGALINVLMDRVADLHELVQAVHNVGNPDGATGSAQDEVCALTGTVREPATPSTTLLLLIGTVATNVPQGSRASDPTLESVWTTDAAAVLVAATVWAATTALAVGQIRSNASRLYIVITAGTTAGAGGPTTTAADITDGTVHWKYLGEGVGALVVAATCTVDGPTIAAAYEISEIDTPVSGWNNVTNLLDAEPGRDIETDELLRARREVELTEQGASIPDAIRAEMLGDSGPAGITHCTVFYNNTDLSVDGIPPHSVEVLVRGGVTQDILDQLQLSVAAGIRTHGSVVGTATDSQGVAHTFKFTRATELTGYVTITVDYEAGVYATGGAGSAAVKAAVVAFGDTQGIGRDMRARPIGAAVVSRTSDAGEQLGVLGVIDTPNVKIGLVAVPTLETTIVVTDRQVVVYDTTRVTVVENAVTP